MAKRNPVVVINGKRSLLPAADSLNVRLGDTDDSHVLTITWNEDEATADRTLNLVLGGADRSITINGNPTLNDWFDQSVKTGAAVTFDSLAVNTISSKANTTVTVSLGTDAGDDFVVGNNNALVVEGDTDNTTLGGNIEIPNNKRYSSQETGGSGVSMLLINPSDQVEMRAATNGYKMADKDAATLVSLPGDGATVPTFNIASTKAVTGKTQLNIKAGAGQSGTDLFYVRDNSNNVLVKIDANGGAVFNENSNDADFRVESNGNANTLFVDGSTDGVGLGTANPATGGGSPVLALADAGSDPSGMGGAGIFAKDVTGTVQLFGIDDADGANQLTQHANDAPTDFYEDELAAGVEQVARRQLPWIGINGDLFGRPGETLDGCIVWTHLERPRTSLKPMKIAESFSEYVTRQGWDADEAARRGYVPRDYDESENQRQEKHQEQMAQWQTDKQQHEKAQALANARRKLHLSRAGGVAAAARKHDASEQRKRTRSIVARERYVAEIANSQGLTPDEREMLTDEAPEIYQPKPFESEPRSEPFSESPPPPPRQRLKPGFLN